MKFMLCKIKYIDENSAFYDIICSSDSVLEDKIDERIFFYGMSENDVKKAIENRTIIEDEWQILELLDTNDDIYALI